MDLADFDYRLPEELIAQAPLAERSASRMLVVDRARQCWEDRQFRDLPAFLGPGDCLVLNDSRVFPARLYGRRANFSGGVEVLLLRPIGADGREWEALVRPGRKLPVGERIHFSDDLEAEIVSRGELGERTVRFPGAGDLFAAGFLSGLARGADDRTCGRLGALAAAEVIQHLGARPETSLKDLARENGLVD